VYLEPVVRRLVAEDLDRRGKTAHVHNLCVPADVDRVDAVGAVDDDPVGQAVARGAAESAGEVDVDSVDVGSGQVVDGDEIGAAEGVDVDPLDARGVHRDGAEVAEQLEPVPVGRQLDALGEVGAVETHRV